MGSSVRLCLVKIKSCLMGASCTVPDLCSPHADDTAERRKDRHNIKQKHDQSLLSDSETFVGITQKPVIHHRYSIDEKTLELLSKSNVETPIDSGQSIPDYPNLDLMPAMGLNEEDSFEMCEIEKNMDLNRVKHLKDWSQSMDNIQVLKIELAQKYDRLNSLQELSIDQSSSLEPEEIIETEQRKKQMAQNKTFIAQKLCGITTFQIIPLIIAASLRYTIFIALI